MESSPLEISTYRTIVETSISPYLLMTEDGTLLWVSDSIRELLGHDPAALVGTSGLDLVHPDSHADTFEALARLGDMAPGREAGWTSSGLVIDVLAVDGRRVSCDVSVATPTRTGLDGFVIQLRRAVGASALQRTVAAMSAGASCDAVLEVVAEMFAEGLAHTTVEILYEWDDGGFTKQVGSPSTVVDLGPGRPHEDPAASDDGHTEPPWVRAAKSGKIEITRSLDELDGETLRRASERHMLGAVSHPVTLDLLDRPAAVVVAWSASLARSPIFDYRVQQAAELVGLILGWDEGRRALEWEASHDPLTTLSNRRAFVDGISAHLATGAPGTVFFLDLDDFKLVNDQHGHLLGDKMLAAVAERLKASTRPNDLVARLGGDEFALFCPDLDDLASAGEAADRLVAALADPVVVEGISAEVGASIGFALTREGNVPDEILAAADTRLLAAKAAGKGQVHGPDRA